MILRNAACLALLVCSYAAAMEPVRVSKDGRGFVLADSQKPFIPWGLNYGHPDQLIEDFWDTDWPSIERDFRYMKSIGANVVRVHLQFGKFMDAADRPNRASLDRLGDLCKLAEQTDLYLDLTGLACYRKADVPAWYDALPEKQRWAAQASFWEAVAQKCASSPAVFCYDLMNEPISSGGPRKPGDWYSGALLGGFDFIQFISLDPAGRKREDVPLQWIAALTPAIRKSDAHHLITVGLLPWTKNWGFLSGFVPEKVAPKLDFIAVHIYPEAGKTDEAIAGLKRFAVGKPVVVEETFPLSCSAEDERKFLLASRGIASGWIGHYSGESIEQLTKRDATQPSKPDLWLVWLKMFKEMGPQMRAVLSPLPR
jgi:hypothetical protein